jgi:hypothetical protein
MWLCRIGGMSISFDNLKRFAADGDFRSWIFPIHVQRSGVTNKGLVICGNSNYGSRYSDYKIDTLASEKTIGGFNLTGYNGNLRGFADWQATISLWMAEKLRESEIEKYHICKDCIAGLKQEQKRAEYWRFMHPGNIIKAYEVRTVCPECHELNYGMEYDSLVVCDWCNHYWALL